MMYFVPVVETAEHGRTLFTHVTLPPEVMNSQFKQNECTPLVWEFKIIISKKLSKMQQ
jgi:hypothetical protein